MVAAKNKLHSVSNPLQCLILGIEHAMLLAEKGYRVMMFVPNLIEPWRVEQAICNKKSTVKGIDVYNISSFKNIIIPQKFKNEFSKADRMMLTELLARNRTRGLARSLLNVILELKSAYFDIDFLKHLLANNSSAEVEALVDTYIEYEKILKKNDLVDDVELLKFAVEHSEKFENINAVFAGFDLFCNTDLRIIEHSCKIFSGIDVFAVDYSSLQIDYVRILHDFFMSNSFDTTIIEDKDASPFVFVSEMMDDEVDFVSQRIKEDFSGNKQTNIFVGSKFEQYHALFLYKLDDNTVGTQGAVRLDHSRVLALLRTVLKTRHMDFPYKETRDLLMSSLLWNENELLGNLDLLSFLEKKRIFPRGIKGWEQVKNKISDKALIIDRIVGFLQKVTKEIPLVATPRMYVSKLEQFVSDKEPVEKSSILNLMHRLAMHVRDKLDIPVYINKLYEHAEENYMEQGIPLLYPVVVAPSRLITTNISEKVWMVGLCEEWVIKKEPEDFLLTDAVILKLRPHNFIRPTSFESQILTEYLIKQAVAHSYCTYPASAGSILSFLKDRKSVKVASIGKVQQGLYCESDCKELIIDTNQVHAISATSLERYIECPYRYFAANVLNLVEIIDDETEISAQVEGIVLHKSMEILLPRALNKESFDLKAEVKKIISKMEEELELSPSPLNIVLADRVCKILASVLDSEIEFFKLNPDLRLFGKEKELCCFIRKDENSLITMCTSQEKDFCNRFKAKIDRIDLDLKNNWLYVIDYKKRRTPTIKAVIDGKSVQVPLYIMAINVLFPEYKCAGGYYIDLYDNQRKGRIIYTGVGEGVAGPYKYRRYNLNIDNENIAEELKKYVSIHGANAIQGINEGKFHPYPIDHKQCAECEFRGCCLLT